MNSLNHFRRRRNERGTTALVVGTHFVLADALMHLAQALTLFPEAKPALPAGRRTHCKLGYFLLLTVGLYLPLSLTLCQTMVEVLLQTAQVLAIEF